MSAQSEKTAIVTGASTGSRPGQCGSLGAGGIYRSSDKAAGDRLRPEPGIHADVRRDR